MEGGSSNPRAAIAPAEAHRSPLKADAVGLLKFLKSPLLNGDDFADLLRQTAELALSFAPFSLLTAWHKSAGNADFDNYFGIMDSISVFTGTDAGENWTKNEFAEFSKPYFDKGKAWNFKAFDRNIYLFENGSVAWFDELLDTWMGTCRGSGVFERIDNIWKLKHYVLSVAIPNESVEEVIEIKQEIDSLFQLNSLVF